MEDSTLAARLHALPTWRQMNRDTSPEVEKRYFEMLRNLPAWRKIEMLEQLNQLALEAAYMNIKKHHPDASEEELQQLLQQRLYREEL